MSTKIHHGYKIGLVGGHELLQFSLSLASQVRELSDKLLLNHFATEATFALDQIVDNPAFLKLDTNILSHLYRDIDERWRKIRRENHRDPQIDFYTNWTFIPQRDYTLALLFTEQETITKLWRAQPQVQPYPYWDNDDPPKDISEEEWDKRGAEWRAALPSAVCECGLDYSVYSHYNHPEFPSVEAVVEAQPTLQSRMARLAKDRFLTAYLGAQKCTELHEYSRYYFEAIERLQTPQGKAELQELTTRLASTRKERYSVEDFMESGKT